MLKQFFQACAVKNVRRRLMQMFHLLPHLRLQNWQSHNAQQDKPVEMEPLHMPYSLCPLQQQAVYQNFPTQEPCTNFEDDFESFLDDNFPLDDNIPNPEQITHLQPKATPPSAERSVKSIKGRSSKLPRSRPVTREQRSKIVNRAAQRVWRERQKVRGEAHVQRLLGYNITHPLFRT